LNGTTKRANSAPSAALFIATVAAATFFMLLPFADTFAHGLDRNGCHPILILFVPRSVVCGLLYMSALCLALAPLAGGGSPHRTTPFTKLAAFKHVRKNDPSYAFVLLAWTYGSLGSLKHHDGGRIIRRFDAFLCWLRHGMKDGVRRRGRGWDDVDWRRTPVAGRPFAAAASIAAGRL
jgi:hypothetical protein